MEGAAIRVAPVGEANLEAVAALVNRAFAKYAHLFPGERTSAIGYADEAGDGARVLLAERKGELVGTAMVARAERFIEGNPEVPDAGYPWTGAFYFGLAGVEPTVMSRGLGRMLIAHAEDIARAEGFERVALSTVREFGLVEYWSRFGYEVFAEHEHPAGHWGFYAPHLYCEMVKQL